MDLKQFTQDALRTESKKEVIQANRDVVLNLLDAYVAIGTLLDQVKKNAFYGKPYNIPGWDGNLTVAKNSIDSLMSDDDVIHPMRAEPLEVNPRVFHGVVGSCTESTEMVEALLSSMYGDELDGVNLGEEIGDQLWYFAILVDELGLDFETIAGAVINKLRLRYPEKFTSEKAINRDVDSERVVLENDLK